METEASERTDVTRHDALGAVAGSGGGDSIELLTERVNELVVVLEKVTASDRSYRAAAAERAVRITELLTENIHLREQQTQPGSSRAGAADRTAVQAPNGPRLTVDQALRSFQRAEARIRMLERELTKATSQRDAARAQLDRLRQRLVVRAGLALVEPIVRLRRLNKSAGSGE